MQNKAKIFIGSLLVFLCFSSADIIAQHLSSSPYSRYGIGEIYGKGVTHNRSMGGSGIALQSDVSINPLNPASYSAFQPKSFTLETNLKGKFSQFSVEDNGQYNRDINIDYLVFGFPVTEWSGFTVGIQPYSTVGYEITDVSKSSDNSPAYTTYYSGEGGLNELYFGSGIEPIDNLSIGIQGSYLFGKIKNSIYTNFLGLNTILTEKRKTTFSDLNITAGLQYSFSIKETDITIGTNFSNKRTLNPDQELTVGRISNIDNQNLTFKQISRIVNKTSGDTIRKSSTYNKNVELPMSLGFGISVNTNGFTILADYRTEKWGEIGTFSSIENNMSNMEEVSLGFSYLPDIYSTSYWKIIHYKFGAHIRNTRLQIRDEQENYHGLKEYGLHSGFMLPIRNSSLLINLGFEAGLKTTQVNSLLEEQYFTINLGLIFKDQWFRKRKFD